MTATESPLAGFTIGTTCHRRAGELAAALERNGAQVRQAPMLRIVALADDTELLAATRNCTVNPPERVIVTTGVGFRGWLELADGNGLGDALRDSIRGAEIYARGPKSCGAIRAAGFREVWSAPGETTSEIIARLVTDGVSDTRVAFQLHGEPLPAETEALRAAGAEVLEVPVYRWAPSPNPAAVHRMVEDICASALHAVTFTSAPAAAALLRAADEAGSGEALRSALRGPVLAAAVGPVTAAPLRAAGIEPVEPARARMGALVKSLVEELPARWAAADAART